MSDELPFELYKFKVNEDYNYYTIRQNARNKYYEKMKLEGYHYHEIKNSMSTDMTGACGWSEATEIAESLNTKDNVQEFYDELLKTGYDEIKPPKKWLIMTINDFVFFALHELYFYWLSKKKKRFISILLNYYMV